MQGATPPQPAADDEAANAGAAAARTPPAPTAGTAPPVAEPANAPATKADDQTPTVPAVEQPPQAEAQSATPTQPTAAEPANAGTATPNAQLKPVAIEQPPSPTRKLRLPPRPWPNLWIAARQRGQARRRHLWWSNRSKPRQQPSLSQSRQTPVPTL